jgi:hypothetical protein
MELRLITARSEREVFEEGLTQARTLKGRGFREKNSSRVAQVHLAFSELYGVYDENGPEPDQMLAGFAMHNMAQFGPTCMRPDLSHLPPENVYEIGELWSVVRGNGLSLRSARALVTARAGCVLIPGLKGARALFIYAVSRREDMNTIYPEFEPFGPPVLASYVETLDGGAVYLQPLVLQRHALVEVFSRFCTLRFETNSDYSRMRIHNPFAVVHVDMRLVSRHPDSQPSVRGFGSNGLGKSFPRSFERVEPATFSHQAFQLAGSVHAEETMKELSTAG